RRWRSRGPTAPHRRSTRRERASANDTGPPRATAVARWLTGVVWPRQPRLVSRRGPMNTLRSRLFGRVLVLGALLALPAQLLAQEAIMNGTVTDTTGGVLPGVTITAVHE